MPTLRVIGEANTSQAQAQFAALTKQVEALNVAMAKTALIPAGGTPAGFTKTTAALGAASRAYNEALAASGAFRVENLRVNDVIEKQTDLLRRQKLGYKDVWGSKEAKQRMRMIKKEQIALRNMTLRAVEGGIGDGHLRATLAIPKDVSKSWDTLRSSVGMFGHELSSVSRTVLNWGKNTQWAGRQLMAGITYPMAAFGAAAGVMAYQVDKQMTRVQKVYNTSADQFSENVEERKAAMAELEKLSVDGFNTAANAAKEYGSSITDTLGVQAELAATGQKGAALQAATTEVMKSAMLGEIDYATTTKAVIALQQTLNLSSRELADTWAYMNSVENQTSLSMADFATAIPIALGPLKQMGGTVQDLGTLLTAMVSRGVQVGKAANAIKATAQRLLRPSKQVQEEFKAITGADIVDIAARNKGNILGMMQELYTVTKDLTDYDKSKAFAGLFGSYQLATMSAMVDGMGDLEKGIGQTTTAYEVGTQSAEQWGEVQRKEIKAVQDSASGQFKRALESTKVALAEAGEPFLTVASVFLKATTQVINLFNELPSKAKNILMVVGIFAALTGPVIMLIGLLANFMANIGLVGGALLKLVGRFNLLNKAEWAQTKLDALYQDELYKTTSAIQLQTQELIALTTAMEAHNMEMQRYMGMNFGKNQPGFLGMPGMGPPQSGFSVAAMEAQMMSQYQRTNKKGQTYYVDPTSYSGATFMKQTVAQERVRVQLNRELTRLGEEHMRSSNLAARNATVEEKARQESLRSLKSTGPLSQQVNENTKRTGMHMKAAGAGAGLMAADFLLMSQSSNEVVDHLAGAANWIAVGAMVGGPWGAALAAAAVAAKEIHGVIKKINEEDEQRIKNIKTIADNTALWADQLGVARKNANAINIPNLGTKSGDASGYVPVSDKDVEAFKELSGSSSLLKSFNDADEDKKATIALQQYITMLTTTEANAGQAQRAIETMFRAAGMGAEEANTAARDLQKTYGAFDANDFYEVVDQQLGQIKDLSGKQADATGAALGEQLWNALSATAAGPERDAMIARFSQQMNYALSKVIDDMPDESERVMEKLGINATNLREAVAKWNKDMAPGGAGEEGFFKAFGIDPDQLGSDIIYFRQEMNRLADGSNEYYTNTQRAEDELIKNLQKRLGLQANVNTLQEIFATRQWQMANLTKDSATKMYNEQIAQEIYQQAQYGKMLTDEQKLATLNTYRLAMGMEAATNVAQGFENAVEDGDKALAGAANTAGHLANALKFNDDQMKDVLQSAMSGLQSDLADAAQDSFSNRMNAAIDAAQAGWDNRIDAMNKKHEAQMDAFDKKWDRRKSKIEDAYDAQIKGIDKAIEREEKEEELRQKMFDAEMTRIERLKDATNSALDLTLAIRTGDLDQAARLQTDMIAQQQGWALSDAADQSGSSSDNRIDKLDKQKDLLERQKDDRIDAMEEEEDRQRKHLEIMQQAQEDALQAQSEASMNALQANWDAEKANLDARLNLFQQYTAKNKQDLKRWLAEVGLSYDDFGNSLMFKGETWAGGIQKSLKEHIREAGLEIANSQLWEQFGAKEAKATLLGMGFRGMGQFKKFR